MHDSIIKCVYLCLDICIISSSLGIVSREFHNFGPSIEVHTSSMVGPTSNCWTFPGFLVLTWPYIAT